MSDEPVYVDGDGTGTVRVKLNENDPFEKKIIDHYTKYKIKYIRNAAQEAKIRRVQKRLNKKPVPTLDMAYVDSWFSWIEKNMKINRYIPIDTLLKMILDPDRYNTWLAKNGKTLYQEERPTDYGTDFI